MDKKISKRRKYLITGITIFVLFLITATVIIIKLISVNVSNNLLYRAKKTQNLNKKIILLETSVALNEESEALILSGDTLVALKDYGLAINYYNRANNSKAKIGSAKANYKLGEYKEAKKILVNMGVNDRDQEAWLLLVKSELKLGDIGNVKKHLLESQSTIKLAETELQELYCLFYSQRTSVHCSVVDISQKIGKSSASIDVIQQYNYLNEHGYPQSAIELLRISYNNGDLPRDGLIELAKVDELAGKLALAKAELLKALTLDQFYPQTYKQLISVESKLNNKEAVLKYQGLLDILSWD